MSSAPAGRSYTITWGACLYTRVEGGDARVEGGDTGVMIVNVIRGQVDIFYYTQQSFRFSYFHHKTELIRLNTVFVNPTDCLNVKFNVKIRGVLSH